MTWLVGVLLSIALFGAGQTDSGVVEPPVTSIGVSPSGLFEPGFMYWYTPFGLFLYPSDFVLLGEVTDIQESAPRDPIRGSIWRGRLAVERVVVCPSSLRDQAARIRSLQSEGFNELARGDRVLVFMVPYEGEYAIPRRLGTNCVLGYKLPRRTRYEDFDPLEFVDLLASGTAWELRKLTADQLRVWAQVDPDGIAEALIRERESQRDSLQEHE